LHSFFGKFLIYSGDILGGIWPLLADVLAETFGHSAVEDGDGGQKKH
jgi:hypothetical protein